jgi:hypothetical protein
MPLTGHICPISEISQHDRNQMFALMQRYYENIDRDTFEQDLDEKDLAIVARNRDDRSICGFSTQMI